jgi:3',5'-cyclic AMP phosphodiesterase CpdA
MTLLLHVSDPHFGRERRAVVEALIALAAAQAPDVVVLSGDITQRARPAEFGAARSFAARLGGRALLAIPGNHDIPLLNPAARLLAPYGRHRATFGHDLEPRWESPLLRVIALNTTRPWRHKDGELSEAQVERAAAWLARADANQVRVVVVHQPLAVIRGEDRPHLLRGHAAAQRRWSEAGVDLVLGGHIHLPYVVALHERDPSLPHRLWVVQAGTAVSSRVRHDAGNSVNLLRIPATPGKRRCRVERWGWQAASGAFELVEAHELVCGAREGPR